MTDEPFFEPWPDPAEHESAQEQDVDLPWALPLHVAGTVLPVGADVYRGADAVVRVTHVVAYRRGLEVHVSAWLRPRARRPSTADAPFWQEHGTRVGLRLADGTRLGHRPYDPPSAPQDEGEASTTTLTQTSGSVGGLTSTSSWWVHPLPAGDTVEVVVQWEHQGVPESSLQLDLAPLREAARREDVLWDPPPPPEEGFFGFSGYSPIRGQAHRGDAEPLEPDRA